MENVNNIFGCFVSITEPYLDASQETKDIAMDQGRIFRTYIWGDKGICGKLEKLKNDDYGKDLELVLFQFYVNPIAFEVSNMKAIEPYRKKEKSIGVSIIVNNENFFSRSEDERYTFLKQSMLLKLDLLAEVVKQKKLDTNIVLLQSDLQKIL